MTKGKRDKSGKKDSFEGGTGKVSRRAIISGLGIGLLASGARKVSGETLDLEVAESDTKAEGVTMGFDEGPISIRLDKPVTARYTTRTFKGKKTPCLVLRCPTLLTPTPKPKG